MSIAWPVLFSPWPAMPKSLSNLSRVIPTRREGQHLTIECRRLHHTRSNFEARLTRSSLLRATIFFSRLIFGLAPPLCSQCKRLRMRIFQLGEGLASHLGPILIIRGLHAPGANFGCFRSSFLMPSSGRFGFYCSRHSRQHPSRPGTGPQPFDPLRLPP